MEYINTEDSDCIKHGILTESPLRGSTTRYVANPILDDIEAPDPQEEYQPPSCLVVGAPSVNDLAAWHWQGRTVDPFTERQLIRRIQKGDPRCRRGSPRGCHCRSCLAFFDPRPGKISLLPAHHHSIRKLVGGYVPKGSPRRKHGRDSDSLIFQDLMAVGCDGLWKAALAFDLDSGNRFWTFAAPKIDGLVRNEAHYLRRHGSSSGDTVARYLRATKLDALGKEPPRGTATRIDRWIFDHLGASPEELVEVQAKTLKRPIFRSLREAADALKAANKLEHAAVYSNGGDDDDIERNSEGDSYSPATEPVVEWRELYDSHDPLKWSPQLKTHQKVSAIVDFWIRELCDPPRIKAKQWPKPIYKPCAVKPTGRVLHPVDQPYWTTPRDERPKVLAGEPYDPNRREVATARYKNGKTKYRQTAASPVRHIVETPEAHAKYVAAYEAAFANFNKRKGRWPSGRKEPNVRTKPKQEISRPTAKVIFLESRRGRQSGFHVRQRHNATRARQ